MINCYIGTLSSLASQLTMYQILFNDIPLISGSRDDRVAQEVAEDIMGWMGLAKDLAKDFEWEVVRDRINIIEERIERGATYREISIECRVLKEVIHSGLNNQLVYRYSNEKSKKLKNWSTDWSKVTEAFPSSSKDILSAVDLWALGHYTSCVFHLMRVLEHGLRALAKDVGREFSVQNWQNILDQIESEIKTLGKSLPAGKDKSERLKFLSESAKEFAYFKDGWRNYVSHGRSEYNENQAYLAISHVNAFMSVLSTKLRENNI